MSGGSMYYPYSATFKDSTTLRRAFRRHLNSVADALRAIEWNESGVAAHDEDDLIRACLAQGEALEQATKEARDAFDALGKEIVRAEMKLCNEAGSDGVRKLP